MSGSAARSEQRVRHRMQQHIRIAMADHLTIVRHVDAAQSQRSAGF